MSTRSNAIAGKKLRCYQSEKTSDRKLSKNCLLYYCTLNLLIFIWLFVGVLLFVVVGRFPISSSSFSVLFGRLFLFLFYFAIWPSKWVQTTRRTCNVFSRIYNKPRYRIAWMKYANVCVILWFGFVGVCICFGAYAVRREKEASATRRGVYVCMKGRKRVGVNRMVCVRECLCVKLNKSIDHKESKCTYVVFRLVYINIKIVCALCT